MDNYQAKPFVSRAFNAVRIGAALTGMLVSEFVRVQKEAWKTNHSAHKTQSPSPDLQ
jgi:hypothetical protein